MDNSLFLRAHPDLDRSRVDPALAQLELTAFEARIRTLARRVFTGEARPESNF